MTIEKEFLFYTRKLLNVEWLCMSLCWLWLSLTEDFEEPAAGFSIADEWVMAGQIPV